MINLFEIFQEFDKDFFSFLLFSQVIPKYAEIVKDDNIEIILAVQIVEKNYNNITWR